MARITYCQHSVLPVVLAGLLTTSARVPAPWAEQGVLILNVTNTRDEPVSATLATRGDGSSGTTDTAGRVRLRLAPQTRPNSTVSLILVAPSQWTILSPWEQRARVPPFDNESENFVQVILCRKRDRRQLEARRVVTALAERINAVTSPEKPPSKVGTADRQKALVTVATSVELEPTAIDDAIRQLAEKGDEAYERGISALYLFNYEEATKQLTQATNAKNARPDRLVNGFFFLGQVYFEQGNYKESLNAYRKADTLQNDDPAILSNIGLCFLRMGDLQAAERSFRASATAASGS